MKINSYHPTMSIETAAPRKAGSTCSEEKCGIDMHEAEMLKQDLEEIPDVRTEEVARARDLVASKDYPSREVLEAVAKKLSVAFHKGTAE